MSNQVNSIIEDHLPYMRSNSEYTPVRTKRDFVRRYAEGEFGNASPTWNSISHMEEDFDRSYPLLNDPSQLWHIRNQTAGGVTFYNINGLDLPDKWIEAVIKYPNDRFYISAMCPTERTILQGEIMQVERGGLNLYYTRVAKPMRDALRESAHTVVGSVAQKFLQHYLCNNSYEWMQTLLDRYPYHVLEFSTFSTCWGTIPNHNTVWWEVRDY